MSYLKENSDQQPILIFDDVFSELDEVHRNLIDSVMQDTQVFVSATDERMVPDIIFFTGALALLLFLVRGIWLSYFKKEKA